MRQDEGRSEGVSSELARVLNALGPEERKELTELLRQPNTFLAEDMDDLIAIIQGLEK